MFDRVTLQHFGPWSALDWKNLGGINLILGGNGSGKTFLLKAIYSALRTLETYKRGDEPRSASEILLEKLHWTFQAEKVGDLVQRSAAGALSFALHEQEAQFAYSFGRDTTRQINSLENHFKPRSANSIFLPAKEILSLHAIILKAREQDRAFGFDDTYYDLALALKQSTSRGKNYKEFADARSRLEHMLGGAISLEADSNRWYFTNQQRQRFSMGVTAEGIKKIAILDTLLGNRYLALDSVVLIDEPEAALHPRLICEFLDIIAQLAARGMQFFIASHSYFVLKKLYLLAQEKQLSIPVLSQEDAGWEQHDLLQAMPHNPIVRESVRLYEQEVELALT
ncbi:ATP-binding protein [Massilia sp. W12]|uniref:ATP-binding protein n=1 Tax=Massilia sp. W12 TaxID=3126507 RepID=UPI0030CAF60D